MYNITLDTCCCGGISNEIGRVVLYKMLYAYIIVV